MKILNLYAGIGGNRKLWTDVEVTAIENNERIAKIYQDFFPNDKVIVADAHQYLLEHFKEFEFIWSSPPCPSHSRARYWGSFGEGRTIIYPDMKLYQEILLLKHYCHRGGQKWVVENVKPYYEPFIKAQECGRHLFWSNFLIKKIDFPTRFTPNQGFSSLQKAYGLDLRKYNLPYRQDNRIFIRNMVEPELGLHILSEAIRENKTNNLWTQDAMLRQKSK